MTTKPIEPAAFLFADDGSVPNNPRLPFLVYRGAIDLAGTPDPEEVIEKTFHKNGWGEMWRNGIFPYVHYHSMIHEGLAVARGRAKVRFGGTKGEELDIVPGRRRRTAGRHRPPVPVGEPRSSGDRRVSQDRPLRPLPRQQGGTREGAAEHCQSSSARQRSGVRRGRAADAALET